MYSVNFFTVKILGSFITLSFNFETEMSNFRAKLARFSWPQANRERKRDNGVGGSG